MTKHTKTPKQVLEQLLSAYETDYTEIDLLPDRQHVVKALKACNHFEEMRAELEYAKTRLCDLINHARPSLDKDLFVEGSLEEQHDRIEALLTKLDKGE